MLTAHSSELFTTPDELKGELSQFVRALPVDLRWTPVKNQGPLTGLVVLSCTHYEHESPPRWRG